MRIGLVDIDTSHPQNWIPLLRELGHEVVALWDGGAVHPADYVARFAAEHRVRAVSRLEDLVPLVDAAIIHSCNWGVHVARARPFVEAGRSVLIDKPVAGNVADLRRIAAWCRAGKRVTGGSSLRFCEEARRWRQEHAEPPLTVICGCGTDEFNYAIHAFAMLFAIMGGGAQSVRHLGGGTQRRIQVNWPGGRMGLLVVPAVPGGGSGLPMHATIVTERSLTQFQVDTSRIYRALLEAVVPSLGGSAAPPLGPDELIEPELCAVAARCSWQEKDRLVELSALRDDCPGYDGDAFASFYRAQKYGK